MELRELLQELRCNILRDVTTGVDRDGDNLPASDGLLLSDASLVRYINDAENKFARQTRCLVSRNDEISLLPLVAGKGAYEIDRRVIDVMRVRIGDRWLSRTTHDALLGGPDMYRGSTSGGRGGDPQAFYFDATQNQITFYPTPSDRMGAMAHMELIRRPMKPLSLSEPNRHPEVPEDFHLDLLEWAAFRALRNSDEDEENYHRANSHRARFRDAVDEYNRDSKLRNPPQFSTNVRMP